MKILLIDDDELDRKAISKTLQKSSENCHIVEARSVDEGLECLASESFDVALLDYRMPEKDGIELLRTLEKNSSLQSTGIIAISSSDDEKVAIKCLKAGAHDFLVKSEICVSKLWRTIAQVKARHELQKQLYESYQKVKQLAEIDPLTGVLNRFAFDKIRKMSLINSPQVGSKIALLLIDLDHFKYTNDQYGHEVGDQVLVQTVSRIRGVLKKHDTLARLGADEFGLLLTNLSSFNSAGRIAKKITRAIRQPFEIDRLKLSVTCSIGIAFYADADSHNDDIIKFADIAMYRAKKNGRNQICFFENMMQQHFLKRFQMENHLKQSINDNELTLNYQPVYRCLDKKS